MPIHHPRRASSKLLFAPLVWSAHFVLCYGLVSLDCDSGSGWSPVAVVSLTAVALLLLGWSGWSNYRQWRRSRMADGSDYPMQAFYALNAFLLCTLSALALSWVAMPALLLPPCVS